MAEAPKNRIATAVSNLSPKRRQYLILGLGASAFVLLVFGGVAIWDKPVQLPQGSPQARPQPMPINAPGAQADPRDIWMSKSSEQMRQMEDMIQGLRQQVDIIEKKPPVANDAQFPAIPLPPAPAPMPPEARTMALPPPPVVPETVNKASEPLPPPKPPGIASFEVSEGKVIVPEVVQKAAEKKDSRSYVPSGSFFRAALLGGLDAPTGGQAQSNPHPVLMRAQDNAFLPNRYRARVKECFLLGSGYGDISSERAYLRLESLSCVLMNGEVVDANAKGYVVGEDGKAGMRGRVVSKQGQILANALMTGVIAGIGQGFQQSATSYSTSALGTVGTVESGKQFQAGIGAGVGKALDRLSQYYISLAEKTFPIIEIDAGRQADVVLTKGVTLAMADAGDDGQYSDIWRRGRSIMKKPLEPGE